MTLLALTPLQAAILSVLTAGAIVALYCLKSGRRRVVVSSSLLWRRVLDEHVSYSLHERLRTIVSIVIAVTIALLIALSLARPQIRPEGQAAEPAQNVAITAFDVRRVPADPLQYEAYLEIQNAGPTADVEVTVTGTGRGRINRAVRLEADGTFKDVFDVSGFGGGPVQAQIRADDDAVADDDRASAYLPVRRQIRTLLVTRGTSYLEEVLRRDRRVELRRTDPQNYREPSDIDAYVFDRFAPPVAPSHPALIVGAPAASWLPRPQGVVRAPEITTWSDGHPLTQYVQVHDVSIERAMWIEPQNLTVIAGSSQTPLIVASEAPRWVLLTFDIGSSDFPLQVGFPVFVDNVLVWLTRESAALRQQPGSITHVGRGFTPRQAGRSAFATVGSHGDPTEPVLASRSASRRTDLADKEGPPYGFETGSHELWFYLLLAASVLVAAEWLTYHRRMTL
jgi:hypothetical protein